MEEAILEKQDVSTTRKNIEAYFNTHDVQFVAEDAVFTHMGSGDKFEGRDAVGQMLHFMYHVAFDAKAKVINTVINDDNALLEARFQGRHIGEFAGLPPTNKEVDVPFCVSYDVEDGFIKHARIYMLGDVLMKQLSN
jgi:predicted ester cyclase